MHTDPQTHVEDIFKKKKKLEYLEKPKLVVRLKTNLRWEMEDRQVIVNTTGI